MTKHDLKPHLSSNDRKNQLIFKNLLQITEQFVLGKKFKSLTETEFIKRLAIAPQHYEIFNQILTHLVKNGLLEYSNDNYTKKTSQEQIITGILRMHPRGFGFVQPHDSINYTQDIFIPKHCTKNGVDGDVVEVEIASIVSEKGPEGKITSILTRARTHLAGIILRKSNKKGQWLVHVPILGSEQQVVLKAPPPGTNLHVGDRIVMQALEWGSKGSETICSFSHHLGNISDPSCDIHAAIEEFELRADFPSHVIEEATSLGTRIPLKTIKTREDLRHITAVTIDPDTAKDFDDALSLTKENGIYHLVVHIADVSHYVSPGTALDDEARLRCNSTYFPNFCLPMLPSVLSDNLCSLKPNVNRLTVSVIMNFDADGALIDHRITRSVIRSAYRFSYREAFQVLQGKKTNVHLPLLQLMVELCNLLKAQRYQRGCVEFSLPELAVIVDKQGMPYKTDYITYDVTHQMVEEFMLKANEIVAQELSAQGKNLTYRVHDEPAEENLRDFAVLASAFGFKIPDYPNPQDLQKFFKEVSETGYANYLAASYIRRMRLAIYSAENIGHYGLSLTHYCHFTSPIRRYMDLVVHRILFGDEIELVQLQEMAARCSEQERISAKAEQNVNTLKKLRLLQKIYQEDPHKQFNAIVTRVKNHGIYFEVLELMLEGFVHISELPQDYFVLDEKLMRLRGVRNGYIYAVGDTLSVMIQSIEFILQETRWMLVAHQMAHQTLLKPNENKSKEHKSAKEKKITRSRKTAPSSNAKVSSAPSKRANKQKTIKKSRKS